MHPIRVRPVQPVLRRAWRVAILLPALLCLLVEPAVLSAQTNSEINTGIQFDFPLPGARSLGMGGAFVAVADDATAAVANPAGLTTLGRPEVSLEGRGWRFISVAPSRGHAFGVPSNIGQDNIAGIENSETADSARGPSFFSAVFPRGRFVVALYGHQQAKYRAKVISGGPFVTNFQGGDTRVPPFTGTMKLDVANYGGSVAYRFANGLALGGGVAFSDFFLDSQVRVQFYSPDRIAAIQPPSARVNFVGLGQTYGPTNYDAANTISTIAETGDDHGAALSVGALFRAPRSKWSVGGAVRLNPEFHYQSTSTWGPAHPFPPARGTLLAPPLDNVAFKVPDVYSAGVAFRPNDHLVVAAQYDRVQFSQLSRHLQDVNGETEGEGHQAIITGLKNPDSNQPRVGMEYAHASGNRVTSIRIGAAYESAHGVVYTQTTQNRIAVLEVLYPETEGQWHVTPGFGFVVRSFQFDAAVDVSSRTQTVSASTVFRF